MNAIIVSIGDELVLGQTVDTNSAWLSQQLAAVGCAVSAHITVGDDQPDIESAIRSSAPQCDFLILTGGIGPTADDLTRQALAAVMNVPLELNESWLQKLRDFFAARKRPMPPTNRIQAMVPKGAQMLDNSCGTAAGIHVTLFLDASASSQYSPDTLRGKPIGRILTQMDKITRTQLVEALTVQQRQRAKLGEILVDLGYISEMDRDAALALQQGLVAPDSVGHVPQSASISSHTCEIYVMPGVPKEMKAMFTADILPHVQSSGGGAVILSRTLHTFGLGESAIAEMLGDLMKRDRNPSVGTTVSQGIVSLRINSRFDAKDQAQRELDATEQLCRRALGDLIYGSDAETLPEIVGHLLKEQRKTVATAESCTGGLLAKMLTDIPGSSTYFKQGWVTYSNEAKQSLLGVPADLLAQHGAVSEPTVQSMAAAALTRANADFALAISGIAGPDGATPTKPVGTVCIALASSSSCRSHTFPLFGDREMIRDRAAKMALTMLRFHLLGKPLPF